jgi:TetR/AcrR family fatty acid metabolism transcriptional regulator
LEAAAQLFHGKAFHEVKVEDIAEIAGIGKGTVYEYFCSKDAIFKELIAYCTNLYMESAKEAIIKGKNSREKLEAIVNNHIEFLVKYNHLYFYVFTANCFNFKETFEFFKEQRVIYFNMIGEILKEGIDKSEVREIDIQAAAASFTGSLISAINPFFIDIEKDGKKIAREIVDIFYIGVGK